MKGSWGRIWLLAFRNSLADRAAYRGDFLVSLVVTVLFEGVTPLVTVLMYSVTQGSGFPGWTMAQALLVQAIFLISRGLSYPLFFALVWTVHQLVREGQFELVLLKPRSPLLVCLTRSVDVQSVGRLLGGLVLFVWVLGQLPSPGPLQWAGFAGLLVVSTAVMFSCAILMAATLFVWVGNSRLFELAETIFLFGQYPTSIYSAGFQILLTMVVPVAVLASLPAQALLGKDVSGVAVAVPVAAAFVVVSLMVWRTMIRRYTGAGG